MADRIAVDEEENKRQRLENERKRMKEVDLLSKILPDTKSQTKEMAGIQTQANALIDPKLYTDMTVNWRATATLMGKPLDELDATQYGDYKAQIAVKLNKPAPRSESEYRSMLSEYFVKEKGKDTALNELYGNVVLKAFQDTGMGKNRALVGLPTEYVKQWEEQHKDLIGGDAGFHAQANRVYNQTLKDIESIRGRGAETFSALMDFTQGKADDERIAQVAERLSSSTPEERQKVYSYIGLAAEAGHIDRAGIEQFAINMGQSFSRGFDFIPQGTLQLQEDAFREMRDTLATGKVWLRKSEGTPTLNDVYRPSQGAVGSAVNIDLTGREATPEEVATLKAQAEGGLKTFGVIRELRNAAKSSVDPIRPVFEDSAIERGAYGLAGSLGIMVPVAINPAIGMLAYQAQEYDRIMLENPDIDPSFAKGLSLVEGAGNAALDRLQLGAINGKLPVFGGLLNGIKNNGIRRVLTTVGVEILEQNLQEGAQDLIAPLTETMAAALREDMPDKDFGELMKDYVGSRAETFFAVLPLALIGGGIGTYRDLKNPALQLADKQLSIAGFGPAQRDYINKAESPEERDARIQQEWSKRTEQDITAGKEQLAASIAEARSQKAGDTVEVNTKADGSNEWIVRDPAGKEVARVASEDEAVTIIADRGEAEIKSQANVVADLLDSDWRKDKLPNFEAQFGGEVTVEQMLKDAEAKGDTKLVEAIKASIEAHGNDPTELAKLRVLGESRVTPYAEGQYKAFVKLNEGATAQDAFEELAHNIFDIDIAEGRITKEQAREWVSQTTAAGVAGYKFSTDAEVRESMAQIAQDFARNKIDQTNLPSSFVAFLKKLYTEFVEFMRRAKLLDQAFAEGKIDAEFERYLMGKIGLSDSTMIEREVSRIEGEQGGGQQLDLFQDSRATPEAGADVRTVGDTKIVGPTSFAIRAYHGTPHEVDRFSTEKIGSGEGAQVYGWGLYFAQNRNVAQNYKERLTNGTLILDGVSAMENRTKTGNLIWGHASEYFASGYKTKETLLAKLNNARKFEKDGGNKYFPDSDYIQVIDALENTIELSLRDEGNLYTVELDAEDHELLDWDKPLSEQSEEVRKALESIIKDRTATEIADSYLKEATAQGATIYQLVAGSFGEREGKTDIAQASEAMASLGIKGIRYLDQGSRDSKEGTHNFVIFDGKHIQITEKNGQPVSVEDVPVDGGTSFSIREKTPTQEELDAMKARLPKYFPAISGDDRSIDIFADAKKKKLIGHASIRPDKAGNRVVIRYIQVRDEYKKQGYGEVLYREIAKVAQKNGIDFLYAGSVTYDARRSRERLFDTTIGKGESNDNEGVSYEFESKVPSEILFSIQSQEQIDRVNKAVSDTTQFAEGRMALYERAKDRFKAVLAENKDILDALKEGGAAPEKIRRAKLIQGIAELEVILRQLPAEVRGKVGGFGVLARGGTGDTFLANFFRDRVRMIDEQLEKYLSKEYDEELYRVFERAKPKKDKPGEKPKGIGADIQDLFAKVKEAQRWSAEEINAHLAAIDSRIDSEDLSPSDEARLIREADLIGLVGGWRNKDSNAKAHAIATLKETWAKGYYNFILKKMQEKEQREADRMEAIAATGKEGVLSERQEADKKENGWKGKFKKGYFNLISFDQFVSVLFGEKSDIATRLANGERNANSQKEDATQSKMDEISKFFAGLAGKDKLKGEQLRWKMAQKSLKPFEGTRWSELEFSEMEAVAATMLWMQEDGKRHMIGKLDDGGKPISAWNYTQEFVDLLEANLSKEAKALRDFLLKKYDTEYDSINKVYKALNGINLPKIANYSPVTVAPVNAPAGTAIDPVTGGVMAARGTSPGALRSRGQAIAEPKFNDVLQTYIAHTKQMEHWKAYAPFMAEANGILRNRDVQNAIEAKGGKEAKAVLNTWTDLFSQGGVRSAEAQLGLSKDISEAGGRAARVALVGRIGTIIIQSTQLGAALAEMPTGAYILRMSKLLSGNLGWKAAFESDYIQRRLNEMPPIVRQAVEGLKSDRPNVVKSAVEKLGRLISGADALFTAGTYAITYDYHLKQAKQMGIPSPEAYAKGVAERAVDKLAQPTRMGARSVIENTSTGLIRNFWAFASESRKNLGLAAYAINVQDPARIGRTLVSLVVLNSLLGNVIRNAWSDARDDDDDEWFDEKHWGLKRMLTSTAVDSIQVRGIPVLGDAISTGFYDAVNQYHQTGSLINFGGFIRAMKHIPKYVEGDADWEMTFKDIDGILSVGGLFNESIAAAASLSHLANDAFGVSKNAKKAVTGD
jgi:GNAT superfamily N-acetyltransferase/murein L,D-transpeptidase YafK